MIDSFRFNSPVRRGFSAISFRALSPCFGLLSHKVQRGFWRFRLIFHYSHCYYGVRYFDGDILSNIKRSAMYFMTNIGKKINGFSNIHVRSGAVSLDIVRARTQESRSSTIFFLPLGSTRMARIGPGSDVCELNDLMKILDSYFYLPGYAIRTVSDRTSAKGPFLNGVLFSFFFVELSFSGGYFCFIFLWVQFYWR